MVRATVLALLCACGRIGFTTSIDDASGDATPDAQSFTAWATPAEVTELTTNSQDFGPTFSPTTLEVYVASRFTGDADIYRYIRPSTSDLFGTAQPMTALNIAGPTMEEGEPSLSDDGLTIYFNRYSPDQIFVSTRSTIDATDWTAPVLVDPIHPTLAGFHSVDFAGDLRMVATKGGEIWEVTRPSATATWGAPVSLGITGQVPCLRRDGLELLWEGSVTIAGMASVAIWRATRTAIDQPFGAPERLSFGALDVAGVGDPELSHDGRTLIFSAQEMLSPTKTYDIYITERDPI